MIDVLNTFLGRIHVATILIILLGIVGGISVLIGGLDWESYFKDMCYGAGLLGIGRGIAGKATIN